MRVMAFTDGKGIEELVREGGAPRENVVLPDKPPGLDEAKIKAAFENLCVARG